MRYDKHIFICANQKEEGKTCCGETHGMELVAKFREVLKERGLSGTIRAQKSGCLDACKFGPSLVIYPEGTYYQKVSVADVERIVDQHVIGNQEVSDLVLNWDQPTKN